MTLFEKWKQDHPGPHVGMSFPPDCPHHYGYAEPLDFNCDNMTCSACWQREIPEEPKEEKKMIYAHVGPFDPTEKDKIVYRKEPFPEDAVIEPAEKDIREWMDEKAKQLAELTKQTLDIEKNIPRILDSGARREFGTGAVRDIQEGKGRCDLLPLDVVCQYYYDIGLDIAFSIFELIGYFKTSGNPVHLLEVLKYFCEDRWDKDCNSMFLEVSIHFEEGAKKYGENNWQKGIPVHCYIDSAVRHYLKFLRGDKDEPHDRAFAWNIMCAIWTCKHKPELNDYAQRDTSEVEEALG